MLVVVIDELDDLALQVDDRSKRAATGRALRDQRKPVLDLIQL